MEKEFVKKKRNNRQDTLKTFIIGARCFVVFTMLSALRDRGKAKVHDNTFSAPFPFIRVSLF